MSTPLANPYVGLSLPELKNLRRLNKSEPDRLKLVDEAIEQLKPPYKAGKLDEQTVNLIAEIMHTVMLEAGATPQDPKSLEKYHRAQAVLKVMEPLKRDHDAGAAGNGAP